MCMLFLHNFPAEAFPFFLQEMPRLTGYTTDNLHQRSQIFHISIYYRLFLPPAGKRDCSFTFIRLFFHCFQLTKLKTNRKPGKFLPLYQTLHEVAHRVAPHPYHHWSWTILGPYQLRTNFGQRYLYTTIVRSKQEFGPSLVRL